MEFRGDRGQTGLSVQARQRRSRIRGQRWGGVEGAAALPCAAMAYLTPPISPRRAINRAFFSTPANIRD